MSETYKILTTEWTKTRTRNRNERSVDPNAITAAQSALQSAYNGTTTARGIAQGNNVFNVVNFQCTSTSIQNVSQIGSPSYVPLDYTPWSDYTYGTQTTSPECLDASNQQKHCCTTPNCFGLCPTYSTTDGATSAPAVDGSSPVTFKYDIVWVGVDDPAQTITDVGLTTALPVDILKTVTLETEEYQCSTQRNLPCY